MKVSRMLSAEERKSPNEERGEEVHPGFRIDKIPVSGAAGLLFALASMGIFLWLPEIRWFLALAVPAGVVVAIILRLTDRS
jgi:hypothetical protein